MKFAIGNNSYRILRKSVFCGIKKKTLWNFISYRWIVLTKNLKQIEDAKKKISPEKDGSVSRI